MKKEAKSRFGIGMVVSIVIGLMLIALGAYGAWYEYSRNGLTEFTLLGVILALLGIVGNLLYSTFSIVVNSAEIFSQWGPLRRVLPFERVEEIRYFNPTFGQKGLFIYRDPRVSDLRALSFTIVIYANSKESVQAILEAAHRANPECQD